jgi:uncharacterized protein YndB with AHSA1/START domain
VNATLLTRDGRSVLRFERALPHRPEKVWRAITEPDALAGWFPWRVEGEWKVGAPLRFVESGQETHGEVLEVEPPRVLRYSWGPSVLRFELRDADPGCVLIFTHTFDDRSSAASYATGWQGCLDALTGALLGHPSPVPPADEGAAMRSYRVRHEAYAQVFELLAGAETTDGIRFERVFPYPAGRVWAAIGGETAEPGKPAPDAATAAMAADGEVTAVDTETTLAYDAPSGSVRWSLEPGPGGTLVTLTQQVAATARVDALVSWHSKLESLAAELAETDPGVSDERALRAHYAATIDHISS